MIIQARHAYLPDGLHENVTVRVAGATIESVAKSEADLEPGVAAGEVLLGAAADTLLNTAPDRLRDRRAATVGSEDPAPRSWHQ